MTIKKPSPAKYREKLAPKSNKSSVKLTLYGSYRYYVEKGDLDKARYIAEVIDCGTFDAGMIMLKLLNFVTARRDAGDDDAIACMDYIDAKIFDGYSPRPKAEKPTWPFKPVD